MPLVAILSVGCSKDDDQTPQEMLIGAWKPTKAIGKESINGGTPTTYTYDYNTCEQNSRITLKNGNSGSYVDYSESGGVCTLNDSSDLTYTYDSSTKTLTLTDSYDVTVFTVKSLTATNMIMVDNYTYGSGGSTTSGVEEIYFTKVK